jgi:hypothetical protein
MPVPSLTGRFLAHNQQSRVIRAFYAVDLHTGGTLLTKPTMLQAAFIARVSPAYAWAAEKRMAERNEIEGGYVPLVPPSVSKANGNMLPASITGHLADSEVIAFVRSVGIDRVLEAAVAVEAAQ